MYRLCHIAHKGFDVGHGNLDDMPPRVAATFGVADFVAAEDTRVTLKLLNHLGLKKPMMSYYEHALHHGAAILDRIEAGESCALCSDAGMPCISDPGEQIVKDAIARGITVTPVPGASACVTALAVSGQDTARFVFEGSGCGGGSDPAGCRCHRPPADDAGHPARRSRKTGCQGNAVQQGRYLQRTDRGQR